MSFKVPVKEILKHPGNMRELVLRESFSEQVGTPVAYLPAGTELEIDLRHGELILNVASGPKALDNRLCAKSLRMLDKQT